jgi:hypothetical protein
MEGKTEMSSEEFEENIRRLYGEAVLNNINSSLSDSLDIYNIDASSALVNRVYFDVLNSLKDKNISDIALKDPANIVSNSIQSILINKKLEESLDKSFDYPDDASITFSIPDNSAKNRSTMYTLLYSTFLKQNPNIISENIPTKFVDFLKKQGIEVSHEDNEILNSLYSRSADSIEEEISSSKAVVTTTDLNFNKLFNSLNEVFPNITESQSLIILEELSLTENSEEVLGKLKPDFQDYGRQISEYMKNAQKENLFQDIEITNLTSNTLRQIAIDEASIAVQDNAESHEEVQLENVDSSLFHTFINNEHSLDEAFDDIVSLDNSTNNTYVEVPFDADNYNYPNEFTHFVNNEEVPTSVQEADPFAFKPTQEHLITEENVENQSYNNSTSLIRQENKFIRAIKNFFTNIRKPNQQQITDGRSETKAKRTSKSFNSFESKMSFMEAIRKLGDSTIGKVVGKKQNVTPVINIPGLQNQVQQGIDNRYYDINRFKPTEPVAKKSRTNSSPNSVTIPNELDKYKVKTSNKRISLNKFENGNSKKVQDDKTAESSDNYIEY